VRPFEKKLVFETKARIMLKVMDFVIIWARLAQGASGGKKWLYEAEEQGSKP
jgi:hypothetical protein